MSSRAADLDGPEGTTTTTYAGAAITGVPDRIPERIARLVYLAAIVLPDGKSIFDTLGP